MPNMIESSDDPWLIICRLMPALERAETTWRHVPTVVRIPSPTATRNAMPRV